MYIWQFPDWPDLRWDDSTLIVPLADARFRQGRLLGSMSRLGFDLKQEAQLEALTEDVQRTSEIEGEILDRLTVRSSLARRLGVPDAGAGPVDRRSEGVVEMLLDAVGRYDAKLTAERLFGWQAALFPTGFSGLHRLAVGRWGDDAEGPMQVVSGPIGRQWVHYQAPPAAVVDAEMARFLDWFNAPPQVEGLLRAGLAHLWFVTVHPFEDGNGRVARAIADQALAQSEGSTATFCSMPATPGWSGKMQVPTRRWSRRRREDWTSRNGWFGSWGVCRGRSTRPGSCGELCCRRLFSGTGLERCRCPRGSGRC